MTAGALMFPQMHKRFMHCSSGGLPPLALRFKTRRMPEEEAGAVDSGSALLFTPRGPRRFAGIRRTLIGRWQRRLNDRSYGDQLLFFFRTCVECQHVRPMLPKQVRILVKGRVHPRIHCTEQVRG